MSANAKFWGLSIVVLGLITWSTVESYRVVVSTQQVAEAQALEQRVLAKLDVVRAKHQNLARTSPAPSSRPATTTVAAETTPQ